MGVDWVTVAAQVVNFLILLFLLHRFLYRPILDVMSRREQEIADRLQEAGRERESAENERRQLEDERRELDRRRQDLLEQAEEEAAAFREELEEEARREVDAQRRRWVRALEREQRELLETLERRMADELHGAVAGALDDLASARLEDQIVAVALSKLAGLDDERRERLRETAREEGELRVATSFEPSDERRDELENAVRRLLGDDATIRFDRQEELAGGLELAVADTRLGWSVRDYLETFREDLHRSLEAQPRRAQPATDGDDGSGGSA